MVPLLHESAMARAIALGEQGRRTAPPNPWVGCVVVDESGVIGEGYHRAPGEPHAEVHALHAAGERTRGATLYVTLEPCAHYGRTPPCADAVIEAGISRVVVGIEDPDPRVSGQGIARLRAGGVQVDVGVCAEEAEGSLAPYLHHRRTGRPFVLLKAAVSMDGRTAAADGSSQWITGPAARADGHRLRAESQAVLVGAGTALLDQPSLTVRDAEPPVDRQPLRVLLDAAGRVPASGPLFDASLAPTLVLTTTAADPTRVEAWRTAGAEVLPLPPSPEGPGVDLEAAFAELGRRGVVQALVEGGAAVHGACIRAGLAGSFVLYVGGLLLGEQGRPLLAGPGPRSLLEAARWRLVDVRRLGDDARLTYQSEPAQTI